MSIHVVCANCKKSYTIKDELGGKKIRCKQCQEIFVAEPVQQAPKDEEEPVARPPEPIENEPRRPERATQRPARPRDAGQWDDEADEDVVGKTRRLTDKKRSRGLLVGLLVGSFLLLLLGGAGALVLPRLLRTDAPHTSLAANQGGEGTVRQPTAQTSLPTVRENLPPPVQPQPKLDLATLNKEIDSAGAGVKLAKLDLGTAGMDLTMDAPEGATARDDLGSVVVSRGDNFAIKISLGRWGISLTRELLPLIDSKELVYAEQNLLKPPLCNFGMTLVRNYLDYFVENSPGTSVRHSRNDCLLMMKCARTLAVKTPLPKDPRAALEQLNATFTRDKDGKVTRIRFDARKVTDATLQLVKSFADLEAIEFLGDRLTDEGVAHLAGLSHLQELDLKGYGITDGGLAHLAGLGNLKSLGLSGTNVTDAGLKHLAALTRLETLSLQAQSGISPEIKGPGLVHWQKTSLKSLNLYATKVDDPGLEKLKGLTNLENLNLMYAPITDAGLENLKGLKNVRALDLRQTKTTPAGVAKLKAALPQAEIRHDGS